MKQIVKQAISLLIFWLIILTLTIAIVLIMFLTPIYAIGMFI